MKKKNNFTSTIIAFVVVVSVATYAYVFEYKKKNEAKEQADRDARVLGLDKDQITGFELHRQSGKAVFVKEGDVWKIVEPVADGADENAVDSFLVSVTSERGTVVTEGEEAKDLSVYGLTTPVTRLVAQAGKVAREVKIGSIKSFDEKLYAQVDDQPKVLLVEASWDVLLSKPVRDLRDKRLMRVARLEADELKVKSPKGEFHLAKEGENWKFIKGGDTSVAINNAQVNSFIETIKAFKADDFASEDKQADRAKLRLKSDWFVEFSKKGETPFRIEITPDKNQRYLTSTDVGIVFLSDKSKVEALDRSAGDFYDKKAPFTLAAEKVQTVEISKGSTQLALKKDKSSWTLAKSQDGKELDSAKVDDLLERISSLEADRFLGKTNAQGITQGKNQIVLSDEKGEKLLQINWGALFTEKGKDEDEKKFYYVKTDKSAQTLLVQDFKIDDLPIASLLKDKVATK